MKRMRIYTLVLLLPLLAGCDDGGLQDTLGLSRQAPDEFTVVSRPPLSVPPEFTLRPPRPGEPGLGFDADEKARSLITGKDPSMAPKDAKGLVAPTVETAVTPVISNETPTGGAASLLKRAGADQVDANIREKLGEDARTEPDTSNAKTLMDKLTGAEKKEPTVDAKKEAERLRSNKDTGKPVTEGEVPVEKSTTDSLIDRIF
jgi:hypothetical protein